MHLAPGRQQRVHRPVPAIGRLNRDRTTAAAGLADLTDQQLRIVVDPHPAELVARVVEARDHRPVQMQIHPYEPSADRDTVAHGGLPSFGS
jgi:hypothetical protein